MVKYFSLQIKTTIRGNPRVALSSTFLVHLEKARHVIDFAHALHYSDVLRTRWVNNGCKGPDISYSSNIIFEIIETLLFSELLRSDRYFCVC